MDAVTTETPVLIRVDNGIGHITLNRPHALHALNTEMCAAMSAALADWANDPAVRMVLVDHAPGTRGFCAGGDIRMVAQSGRIDGVEGAHFFAVEYRLNTQIKAFPKPYITFMDGVTMGGGVGISIHGSHRIATEHTLFAMPETGIGLFPDVGGSWFLPRLASKLGYWLALTGARLKGQDVAAAGIATHHVASEKLEPLRARLKAIGEGENTSQKLDAIFSEFSEPIQAPVYADYSEIISSAFGHGNIPAIIAALDADGGEWANAQADTLRTRSPLSLCVSLEQLKRGATMTSFDDIMRMEYRIAYHIIRSNDFSEGVRAVIEDKDNAPRWSPATLDGVTPAMVEAMFAPLPQEL